MSMVTLFDLLSVVADKRTTKILTRHEYMRECATWQFAATPFADYLQLLLVARIKSRIIVENKTEIALEYERPIDIMYPSLM